jgi:serine/threonine protein phosphatase PrpC
MTTTKLLNSLLISALLASVSAHAAEQQPIVIALEEGKQIASFNVGDSRCVLKNDQIRCAPINIK